MESEFQCHICNKGFSRKANLKRHVEIHAGTEYPCVKCGRVYHDDTALRRHTRTKHEGTAPDHQEDGGRQRMNVGNAPPCATTTSGALEREATIPAAAPAQPEVREPPVVTGTHEPPVGLSRAARDTSAHPEEIEEAVARSVEGEREALAAQQEAAVDRAIAGEQAAMEARLEDARRRVEVANTASAKTHTECNSLSFRLDRVTDERDSAIGERDSAYDELERVIAERDSVIAERDSAMDDLARVTAERDVALERLARIGGNHRPMPLPEDMKDETME